MTASSSATVIGRGPTVLAYAACLRYGEILLLQGSPLLGASFAMDGITLASLIRLLVFVPASFLLVAHVFALNDWAGIGSDANDPMRSGGVFTTRAVTPRAMATLSLGLLVASLLLFALLPARTLLLAVAVALLGIVYSHPITDAKGTPIVSTALHLVGGALHFLLGYSLFAVPDRRGILIAVFFGVTFAAGHLNQELRDHASDRRSGLRTNAVRFGKRPTFLIGLALFTLAYADLGILARSGLVPSWLGWLALALYPAHVFWSMKTLRAGLSPAAMTRLQARYRTLYCIIGLGMAMALVVR